MANFIDVGLPDSRDAWPVGSLDALSQFSQGDVVRSPTLSYFADLSRPVFGATHDYAAHYEGTQTIEIDGPHAPRWAVITTGTCDIGEEDSKRPIRPFVQLSPVVDMSDSDKGTKKTIQRGKQLYFVHVPQLADVEDGFWVADLRFECSADKGWLAGQQKYSGFASEQQQESVGRAIARLRRRPALARRYYDYVASPLADKLTELLKSNPDLQDKVDEQVQEFGLRIDSRLNPQRIEIVLISRDADLSDDVWTWWREAIDGLREDGGADAPTILGPRAARLDQISVLDYEALTVVEAPLAKGYSLPDQA